MNLRIGFKYFNLYRTDLAIAILTIIGFLFFVPIFTYSYFAVDLQSKDGIMNRNNTGLTLLDRNGSPFFYFYQAKNRTFVPLNDISPYLKNAVIAIEDKDFYSHPGFSIKSIIRSLVADLQTGNLDYGGSTITQQLVKNSLLHPQKNFLRKYQEIVLASEVERKYQKDEILEMYLNSVYLGQGAFGVEEAAKIYFGKDSKDLTISEAAVIASLLPSPSSLSPKNGNFEELKKHQQIVLDRMFEQGFINQSELTTAKAEKLDFAFEAGDTNSKGIHFALMIKDQITNKYSEEEISRAGLRVKTTLDLSIQEYAEKVVADQVTKLAKNRVTNGSAVVVDSKTGEIIAMVGSKDWYDGEFGRVNVADSMRPPGSSFKPIVYAAALEKKLITPATILSDNPTTFTGGYKPKDYDGKNRGPVLMRRALSNSLNIPAVEVMSKVGVENTIEFARKMGIESLGQPSDYGLSLVLGAGEIKLLELTEAYSVFANNGERNELTGILAIENKFGEKIYSYVPSPERVLDEKVAFLITSILSDSTTRKETFGNLLDTKTIAAVKTGTTEDYKDSLTMGYTPFYTVGVWVGNNDNKPMDNVAGSLGAAPIWKALIDKLHVGKIVKFAEPGGLSKKAICKSNGGILKEATSSAYQEYFLPGTEPTKPCAVLAKIPDKPGEPKKD